MRATSRIISQSLELSYFSPTFSCPHRVAGHRLGRGHTDLIFWLLRAAELSAKKRTFQIVSGAEVCCRSEARQKKPPLPEKTASLMIPYQILRVVTIDETHNLCCENIFSQKTRSSRGIFRESAVKQTKTGAKRADRPARGNRTCFRYPDDRPYAGNWGITRLSAARFFAVRLHYSTLKSFCIRIFEKNGKVFIESKSLPSQTI